MTNKNIIIIVFFPNDKTGAKLECTKGYYEFKKGILAEKFYYRFISDMEKAPLRWEKAEIEEGQRQVPRQQPD